MKKREEFKAVGMSFLHELPYGAKYPEDFLALHSAMEDAKVASLDWGNGSEEFRSRLTVAEGPLRLSLFRNPDNPYDANAIEVHAPFLGRKSMLGHVPADLAARLAPSLDRGDEWSAWLETVLVDPAHEDKPGALVAVVCESFARP